ncbi:MAG: hypothetical protein NC489_46645, partial [Ruminococcus flavefaciens]|nr:hypothetical protein [Ruminococcus flavefaciens]
MTINEALERFAQIIDSPNATLDDLVKIIDRLSVKDNVAPYNAITHLYTKVGNDKGFINNKVRVLDHTDAYEFLDVLDDEIREFVFDIIKKDNPQLSSDVIREMAVNFIYGNFDNSNNITKGLWGIVSEKFAKQTTGNVICHIGDIDGADNRVWWNVEMPQILRKDSGVTSVNGIPIEQLRKTYYEMGSDKQALDVVNRIVAENEVNDTDTEKINHEDIAENQKNISGDSDTNKDTKKETGDSDTKKDTKKETGDSDTKTDTKKETGDSDTKKDTKKETGDSDTKTDTKKETGDSNTKTDTKKETGDPDTKNHSNAGDSDTKSKDHSKNPADLDDGKLSDKSKTYVEIYEEATGTKVKDIPDTKKVNRVAGALYDSAHKAAEVADRVGDAADLLEAAATVYQAGKLFKEGKEDEAGKLLRDYGLSTLTSIALTEAVAAALAAVAVTNPILLFVTLGAAGLCGSEIGEMISDLLDEVLGLYDDAGAYTVPVDPLVFDLDGDGVETVSVKNGVNFDFDNNGFAEKIGWAGADDGLLVRDLDRNGQIDNGGELFGDQTETGNGILAVNGFEALKAFDGNGDGMIDAADWIYPELKIWQDRNQNGTAEEDELVSLQEAGITAIGLDYSTMSRTDAQGNLHTQKGYYVKSDGSTADIEDVWFSRDTADTVATGSGDRGALLEETEEVRELPDIQGQGNQYSLHQAMLRDSTGHLQNLVEQYVGEEDAGRRKELVTQIIYAWTGVEEYDPAGRGTALKDARELAALEVIAGREFDSRYGKNPVYQAGRYIEQAFDKLAELYYAELESQTTYADLYSYLSVSIDFDENGNLVRDTDKIVEKFRELYGKNPIEAKKYVLHFVENMEKLGITKDIDCDKFYTGLSSFCGDVDHAIAYIGDDIIAGTNDDDILIGEMGNDTLRGGNGDDAYVFSFGDGDD